MDSFSRSGATRHTVLAALALLCCLGVTMIGPVATAAPTAWSGTLQGQVLMPDGKTPVADTELALQLLARRQGKLSAAGMVRPRTDGQGRFSVRVAKAINAIKLIARDLTPATIQIKPSEGNTVARTIRMPPASGVRGRLAPAEGGVPADRIWVCAAPLGRVGIVPSDPKRPPGPEARFAELKPGQTGWEILGLEPGPHEVFTHAPGRAPSTVSHVTVEQGEMAETVVDPPPVPGALSGRVVSSGGKPLADISVRVRTHGGRVRSAPLSARTDTDGRYRLEGLTPGFITVNLVGRSSGYANPPLKNVRVIAGETVENFDFELLLSGTVRGVVKRRDGKPLRREYRVQLDRGPTSYLDKPVAPDGTFQVAYVQPGTYELYLERMEPDGPRLLTIRDGIAVGEGETTEGIELVVEE